MTEQQQQFDINRIYVKDLSLETPNTPHIFTEKWEPEISLAFDNTLTEIEAGIVDVSLTITVTVKVAEKTAYILEVEQAGIFTIVGFEDEQKAYIIGAVIPNTLFPYARETISSLSQKAGFPPMLLTPIDFNMLYQQHLAEQAAEQNSKTNGDE